MFRHLFGATSLAALAALAACGSSSKKPQSRADGERLVFSQQAGEHRQLFTLRPDGTGLRQVTRSPADSNAANWSPDGRHIVYGKDASTHAGFVIVDRNGSAARALGPFKYQDGPAFSPDGQTIEFTGDPAPGTNGIYAMRSDGSGVRRLTSNPWAGAECGCDGQAEVSPDGTTVAFVRERSESRGLAALFTMRIDGSGLKRITSWRIGAAGKLAFSPDGRWILLSDHGNPQPQQSSNVYLVHPDGTGLHALTHFRGGRIHALPGSFSPDGSRIVFKTDATGTFQLYVMNADGSASHRITSGLDDPAHIDWGPDAP